MQVFEGCWYLLSQAHERCIISFLPVRFIVLYNSMVVCWQACFPPYHLRINTVSRPYQRRIIFDTPFVPLQYPFYTPPTHILQVSYKSPTPILHISYLTPIDRSGVTRSFRTFSLVSQAFAIKTNAITQSKFSCFSMFKELFASFRPFSHFSMLKRSLLRKKFSIFLFFWIY